MTTAYSHEPNRMNGHQGSHPSADAATDELTFTETVRRLVEQCSSLLRLQLERKIKTSPQVYDGAKLNRVMADFETVSRDIETTVSSRVRGRVVELIQKEVRRVFEDAMSDLDAAIRSDGSDFAEPEQAWPGAFGGGQGSDAPDNVLRPFGHTESSAARGAAVPSPDEPSHDGPSHNGRPQPTPEEDTGRLLESAPPAETAGAAETPLLDISGPSPDAPGVDREEGSGTGDDGVYQGKVRLLVEVGDNSRQLVSFVEELRRKSELRLLQLVGHRDETAEVWLWVRMPLRLKDILSQFGAVANVTSDGGEGDPVFGIRLRDMASVN